MARSKSPAPPPTEPDTEPEAPATPGLPSFQSARKGAPGLTEELYLAEVAAQRSVCHTEPYSDALVAALICRCKHAVQHGPRTGSTNSKVRDLEAPHSKRVPASAVPTEREE